MSKKITLKAAVCTMFVMAMASVCLFGCAQQSAAPEATAPEIEVTVEIDPSAADGLVNVPVEDLTIISDTVSLPEEATAYDALVTTGAQIEGSDSYVTSINGLAEKDAGPTYGWMYEVNGESPTVAANEYVVAQDDVVRWYYSSWE